MSNLQPFSNAENIKQVKPKILKYNLKTFCYIKDKKAVPYFKHKDYSFFETLMQIENGRRNKSFQDSRVSKR
ncbi:hypothetical protein [Halalkalibacter alkaliphilus]|uniref:Uncharacterized protein n=1 Tax=Halalkalibacter alkaliphilus TaxID=2917993 RepID=A0A9X1ZVC4_9BACI|nr:hypothetical protein [Halalkalibacter alkaliphilus]MCL7746184.1 hypothetical protein [Halalkalibacter alkaliphilus]